MRLAFLLFVAISLLMAGETRSSEFKAIVVPLAGENLEGACSFELLIPNPARHVRAIWITYDRGCDISRYYSDAGVRTFAQKQAMAPNRALKNAF